MPKYRTTRMSPVRVDVYCDDHGNPMVFTKSKMLTTYPAMFVNVAANCGCEFVSEKVYPFIEYRPWGDPRTNSEIADDFNTKGEAAGYGYKS